MVRRKFGTDVTTILLRPSAKNVKRIERYFTIALGLILGLYSVYQFLLYGLQLSDWDFMFISGAATLIFGLQLPQGIPQRLDATLVRLVDRGALQIAGDKLSGFETGLKARAEAWAHKSGLLLVGAILLAFAVAFGLRLDQISSFRDLQTGSLARQSVLQFLEPIVPIIDISQPVILTIVGVLGGYVVGRHLGRFVLYGRLGALLEAEGARLNVLPGHLDGAAGLKPVGDFYFFQAMLAAVPAIFLALWWLIIPLWPKYAEWRGPYLGLLAIALTFEVLAFLVPLWSFHKEMQAQKSELFQKADELSQRIVEIQAELAQLDAEEPRKVLKDQLSYLTEQYWAIEQLPTWPVDSKTRRRFTFNNVALFLPLISKFFELSDPWRRFVDLIGVFLDTSAK
jgi:hypothetical protein